jgi:hypothetical protein
MLAVDFNPEQVARLELGWWQAHNDKDRVRLKQTLRDWVIKLYKVEPATAATCSSMFITAASLHDRDNFTQAVGPMGQYYALIQSKSGAQFDPHVAARLEVGWWQIHDELEFDDDKSRLIQAFVELYALLYGLTPAKVRRAAELKTRATKQHDLAEAETTPLNQVELHWRRTGKLLREFYVELKRQVNRVNDTGSETRPRAA